MAKMFFGIACLAWLHSAFAAGRTNLDFKYYLKNNSDTMTHISPEITVYHWSVSEKEGQQMAPIVELLTAPALTRVDLLQKNATYPTIKSSYWLPFDTSYVVTNGNATFGTNSNISSLAYAYGDVYWVAAGVPHGPFTNTGSDAAIIHIMTESFSPQYTSSPSQSNPSTVSSDLTERAYRNTDTSTSWRANPSPHTDECLDNGGVYNKNFPSEENTMPVLRVAWGANCSIPYHYHPTGALYFIQYGEMMFRGDYDGYDMVFGAGDVRWVRPGFDYGPEYNSAADMQITVFGTDTPPQFSAPPAGPYVVTKTVTVSHAYPVASHNVEL